MVFGGGGGGAGRGEGGWYLNFFAGRIGRMNEKDVRLYRSKKTDNDSGINRIKSYIPSSKPKGKEAYTQKLTKVHERRAGKPNEQLFPKHAVIQPPRLKTAAFILIYFKLQNKTEISLA